MARRACTFRLMGRFLTTTRILGRLGSSGGSSAGALACGDMTSEGDGSLYPLWGVLACKITLLMHQRYHRRVGHALKPQGGCARLFSHAEASMEILHPAEVPVLLGEVYRHSLQPFQGKLHVWSEVTYSARTCRM